MILQKHNLPGHQMDHKLFSPLGMDLKDICIKPVWEEERLLLNSLKLQVSIHSQDGLTLRTG